MIVGSVLDLAAAVFSTPSDLHEGDDVLEVASITRDWLGSSIIISFQDTGSAHIHCHDVISIQEMGSTHILNDVGSVLSVPSRFSQDARV